MVAGTAAPTGPGLGLDEAVALTRTGDLWLFRGRRSPDRAIQTFTNSPVNHVGMAVVVDDLPPLLWHAELAKKLLDHWTGGHHRGVQLHDLREAVVRWQDDYGQSAPGRRPRGGGRCTPVRRAAGRRPLPEPLPPGAAVAARP
jgi:hypothetical protein